MLVEGKVGPVVASDQSMNELRQGRSAELLVADAHGRYTEATYRGLLYSASNQAAQAVSVALATTYTGLCIANPLGNQKNVAILGAQFALSSAPVAIASLHLIGGYSATANVTLTTAGIATSNLLGVGPIATAKVATAATIPTPTYLIPIGGGFTAAALPSTTPLWIDLGGIFVLPPGGFIAIGALTTVTGFGGFVWEEIPL